jgi:hypothetical protein
LSSLLAVRLLDLNISFSLAFELLLQMVRLSAFRYPDWLAFACLSVACLAFSFRFCL